MAEFLNTVVLITGGTDGISLATASAFSDQGAQVIIAARDAERGARMEQQLQQAGGRVSFAQADMGEPQDIPRLISMILERYGRLDYAVNNAATKPRIAPITEVTDEDFEATVAVNLKGLWLCMKHEILAMKESGGGAIVNISSINGLSGTPSASIYSATKHAVIGLTRSVAREYIADGIRINAVCPGAIDTAFQHGPLLTLTPEERQKHINARNAAIPAGRLGCPEEIAAGVLWLCSAAASYVVGHMLVIDGGVTA